MIKNIIPFILVLLAISLSGLAQTSSIEAKFFAESYSYEAKEEYQKALTSLEAIGTSSYPLTIRKAWLSFKVGEYNKSEALYRKAIDQEPNSLEARFGLIYPLNAMERYEEIISIYKDILETDPKNTQAQYWLAYALYLRKEYDQASALLTQLLSMYPFDYSSNLLYGEILLTQGKITEAKSHFFNALRYNPTSSDLQAQVSKL